ncbi:hypothetical protein FRACA_2610003 [Frankia canadensis]|uniref:Transposase n=1 Tax=Frankia canadensis TaxID=1836972 RepID=A0A2I2KSH1_9ACTN|nr:hypothetical protein [Frankia canadensis]SNQ48617.1 hypothetical protein FRACA_2610003 [Frankia canadensis]SOU55907.1 hypothetical protein FRACA_2610003 [Frankia canadensis]
MVLGPPLPHVESWARRWAVEEMFDIAPDALNDDRVGRALDALAPVCDEVAGSVGAAAIAAFGVDISRVHSDITTILLHGAYREADGDYAAPRHGHPKDRRADLKQVQTGLATTGDGGIPLLPRAYDGGAGEVSQVPGALRALVALAGPREFLLVGDTKLVSYANLTALTFTPGVTFLAPAAVCRAVGVWTAARASTRNIRTARSTSTLRLLMWSKPRSAPPRHGGNTKAPSQPASTMDKVVLWR